MDMGRELRTIQNIECYSKGGQTFRRVGYATIYGAASRMLYTQYKKTLFKTQSRFSRHGCELFQ